MGGKSSKEDTNTATCDSFLVVKDKEPPFSLRVVHNIYGSLKAAPNKLDDIPDNWTAVVTKYPVAVSVHILQTTNFATRYSSLVSVDLSGLLTCTAIGEKFCRESGRLQSVNLSGMTNCKTIGDDFLTSCPELTSVDLSGMSQCLVIGEYFCNKCVSLTSLDMSGMRQCKEVGRYFAKDCKALTTLQLTGMSKCTKISDAFLNGCVSLKTVNVSDMIRCEEIGELFARGCKSLTHTDLSGMTQLAIIGDHFCLSCPQLQVVDASGVLQASVGSYFCLSCPSLTSIELNNIAIKDASAIPSKGDGSGIFVPSPLTTTALREAQAAGELRCIPFNNAVATSLLHPKSHDHYYIEYRQWCWKHHMRCSKGVRKAVLMVFQGLTFVDPHQGEVQYLPAEIAREICSYFKIC